MDDKKRKYDEIERNEINSANYNILKFTIEHEIKSYILEHYGKEECNVIAFRDKIIKDNYLLSYSKFEVKYCEISYNIIASWEETYDIIDEYKKLNRK